MRSQDALAQLETPVDEKARYFCPGAETAEESINQSQEPFQLTKRWGKSLADRPTPDDWPAHE